MKGQWLVQILGRRDSGTFEISIVREDNEHGRRSYGWFNENKLCVSTNGGPMKIVLTESIWNWQIAIANEVCDKMNAEEAEAARPVEVGVIPIDGYKVRHV